MAVITAMVEAAWESVTLGEVAIWLGVAGGVAGGGGSVLVGRWVLRTLRAGVRALNAVTLHLEASTAAARAGADLAPLAAAALRVWIREHHGEVPAAAEDSDQVRVLRVAAEGDDDELERAVEQLARLPPGATLPTSLGRAVRRLVQLEEEAHRRRARPGRDEDAPRPRARSSSWWPRRGAS